MGILDGDSGNFYAAACSIVDSDVRHLWLPPVEENSFVSTALGCRRHCVGRSTVIMVLTTTLWYQYVQSGSRVASEVHREPQFASANVELMDNQELLRPREVGTALKLLWGSLLIFCVFNLIEFYRVSNIFEYQVIITSWFSSAINIGFIALFFVMISKGRNWVRFTLLVVVALGT